MVSVFAGNWQNWGWLATALCQSADDPPQFVVRQVADNPERFAVVAALASENLNGEQMQLRVLSHRTSGLRIKDERVRGLKGSDWITGRTAGGSRRHRGESPCHDP
jgi:hypothetical protein